jgi:hypothetical protein
VKAVSNFVGEFRPIIVGEAEMERSVNDIDRKLVEARSYWVTGFGSPISGGAEMEGSENRH